MAMSESACVGFKESVHPAQLMAADKELCSVSSNSAASSDTDSACSVSNDSSEDSVGDKSVLDTLTSLESIPSPPSTPNSPYPPGSLFFQPFPLPPFVTQFPYILNGSANNRGRFPFPPPLIPWPFFYRAYAGTHGKAGFNTPLPEKEELPEAAPSPPPFEPPEDYQEIRKLVRKKMHRCKVCKNRFIEKDIYERHLRDKHPERYELYANEQSKFTEDQRLAELEQVRREEIRTGGFILPAREVEEAEALADPNEIKLPLELDVGGYYTVYDEDGLPLKKRRPYVKKVSPQCPFCDKRFRNDCSLKKHVAKKHPEAVNFVQCNRCFKTVKNSDELKSHDCELTYLCWSCCPIRNMCSKERLEMHTRKFHRGTESGFKCNECARKFLTPRKLRKHKKMAHVVEKPYKCHFCDEYLPTDTQTALHERIHTGKLVFECNICDYKANRFVRLQEHQRREHGYTCVLCNDHLLEWSELKLHTSEKHYGYLSAESQMQFTQSSRVWVMFLGD